MCCKLMRIDALAKPTGTWCAQCIKGKGCGIYPTRPLVCRTFHCLWTTQPGLGPEWRPDRCKMVLIPAGAGRTMVKCDPGAPTAWRKQPYLSAFMQWAERAGPQGGEVIICVGHDVTIVARGRELHVGMVTEDDELATEYDAAGRLVRCRVIKPDAPLTAP